MMIPSLLVVALLASCEVEALRTSRSLSFDKIAGYEPSSKVTDHNAIDLDQSAMEEQLGTSSEESFALAKLIYENGGNSKSYATIALSAALGVAFKEGEKVTGFTTSSLPVVGTLYADYDSVSTEMKVLYDTIDKQATYMECQVGDLVKPNLVGCLSSNGTITIGSTSKTYTYDPAKDNNNGRTLAYFSTKANTKMRPGEDETKPYFVHFQKFFNYYGSYAYSDDIIQAAFAKTITPFESRKIDFRTLDPDPTKDFSARSQIIKKSSVFMGVAMYVIRELEDALVDCNMNTPENNKGGVYAVDEAAAFYSGSNVGSDGTGKGGVLMYSLADKRCMNFKTCGETGDLVEGTSKVNLEMVRLFTGMAKNVLAGDCTSAEQKKEEAVSLIFIPLIQGTLRYAQIRTTPEANSVALAEGAAFAMAILPMVHECNEASAQVIFDNMLPGSTTVNHKAVKLALESVYDCMGITCAEVGGLVDEVTGDYLPDSGPCGGGGGGGANVGLAVGLSIGGVVVLALIALFVKRQKAGGVEFKSDNV